MHFEGKTTQWANQTQNRHSNGEEKDPILIKPFLLFHKPASLSALNAAEANSLAEALETLVDYMEYKERKKGYPSSFFFSLPLSVLPCSWQSRAPVNSRGKGSAEWSRRSGAHSCRELPSPSIPAPEKRVASCCLWAFFPGFNRSLVKGAQAG